MWRVPRRNRNMFHVCRHLPSAERRRDDQLQEALHVWGQLRLVVLWRHFGGISAWSQQGVAAAQAARTTVEALGQ